MTVWWVVGIVLFIFVVVWETIGHFVVGLRRKNRLERLEAQYASERASLGELVVPKDKGAVHYNPGEGGA